MSDVLLGRVHAISAWMMALAATQDDGGALILMAGDDGALRAAALVHSR